MKGGPGLSPPLPREGREPRKIRGYSSHRVTREGSSSVGLERPLVGLSGPLEVPVVPGSSWAPRPPPPREGKLH